MSNCTFMRSLFLGLLLIFSLSISAQNKTSLLAYLRKMDSSAAFRQASWGFSLLNSTNGAPIVHYQADKSLVPASVQKVFTTATALALLGDTFHFKTKLVAD